MGPTVSSISQCPGLRDSPSASSLPGSHGGLHASDFHRSGPSLLLLQTWGPDVGRSLNQELPHFLSLDSEAALTSSLGACYHAGGSAPVRAFLDDSPSPWESGPSPRQGAHTGRASSALSSDVQPLSLTKPTTLSLSSAP